MDRPRTPPDYRRVDQLARIGDRLSYGSFPLSLAAVANLAFTGNVTLSLCLLLGFVIVFAAGARMVSMSALVRERIDADLARIPDTMARNLASFLYSHYSVCSHSPSDFERAARVWMARGYLELPYGSRKLDQPPKLPRPLVYDWDFLDAILGGGLTR